MAVILVTDGQPRDLRRPGPDFDGTVYFQELEARGVHTRVTDDDPAFHKALQGCGRDRPLCVVHLRRTVCRRRQRMRQGRDRILLTLEAAAVLQGVVQRVRPLPLWGGQLLLVCCEWAHQGVVRLSPLVRALVEQVMARWNDLVRFVRDLSVPSSTHRLEGWWGRFQPQARLARGLKTPQGAQAFLHLLAGSRCRNAVLGVLQSLGLGWHTTRQYLREWLHDGADRAAPCRVQLDVETYFAPLLRWVLAWRQGSELTLASTPRPRAESWWPWL